MSERFFLIFYFLLQIFFSNAYNRPKYRYTPRRARWFKYNLSYSMTGLVSNKNQTSNDSARKALRDAFQNWQSVSCFDFFDVTPSQNADIKIVFTSDKNGHQDCDRKFYGTAAHAFFKYHSKYPATIHVNNELFWMESENPSGSISLTTVLLHEIGHVLGLYHSSEKDSVMHEGIFTNVVKKVSKNDEKALEYIYKSHCKKKKTA